MQSSAVGVSNARRHREQPSARTGLHGAPRRRSDFASVLRDIVEWASEADAPAVDLIGATDDERRELGALGGLAAALLGHRAPRVPTQLSDWMADAPSPPDELTARTRSVLHRGEDVLAEAYSVIVSAAGRRRLGTFFTPPPVVTFMLRIAAELMPQPPAHVVDPGAGVGAFSAAAARRWGRTTVQAIDLNIVTLGLLVARCAVDGVTVVPVLDDYLAWLGRSRPGPVGPMLYIGNPPYTRHHDLTPRMRKAARRSAPAWLGSGMHGLSTYFLAATLAALRDEDALVFLLPSSWTESSNASTLLRRINKLPQRAVRWYEFAHADAIFPDVMVHALILAISPQRRRARRQHLQVRLDRRAVGVVRPATYSPTAPTKEESVNRSDHVVPLETIAKVRRGIATGANAFFFLTDELASSFPVDARRPGLLRLRQCKSDVLDTRTHEAIVASGERCWLLWLDHSPDDPALLDYLRAGEVAGIDKRHLPSKRPHWFSVERADPPDILISPMSKATFRAVYNPARVLPSNAMYGIYLHRPEADAALQLTRWLNSAAGQAALRHVARRYGNGLYKLEPRALRGVSVPSIESLRATM